MRHDVGVPAVAGRARLTRRAAMVVGSIVAALGVIGLGAASSNADSGQVVTYADVITIPAPPASTFSGASGGGDGWGVALTSTQLFNVFHHSSELTVNCHNQNDASDCWSNPKTVVDGAGNNFATSGEPGLWVDQASGHLFVFATRSSDGTAGVVCIDTTQPASAAGKDLFCGFTALSAVGDAPVSDGISQTSDPVVVGSKWYAFNYVNGTPSGTQDQMLCFDLASLAACASQPYAVNIGTGTVGNSSFPAPAIGVSGGRIVVPSHNSGGTFLGCFDPATNANCAGTWPASLSFSYASVNGAAFPMLDSVGNPTGFCLPNTTVACFNFDGSSASTPAGLASAFSTANSPWNGPAFVLGPRVYVPNGNLDFEQGGVECFDFSTSLSCANMPKLFSNLDYLYSVNPDPQRPTCIWVNADGGSDQIQNFDAFTGGSCGQGPVRVLASSAVAPGAACIPATWTSLTVLDPVPSSYTSATVQFLDGDGNPIPGATSATLANGAVDLSGMNLSTSIGLPQFLITFTGAPATLSQVQVKLVWTGTYSVSCQSSGATVSGLTVTSTTTTPSTTTTAPTPVVGATTVHTGEPWAGSRPLEIGALLAGVSLVGLGVRSRRRARC